MQSWIPVPGTTTGRLVEAALEQFGVHGFDAVAVNSIAAQAGVTTGSLYHHFGSKAGLYRLVRADVERRVLDRFDGAASARPVRSVADLAPVVLVGFDYLVTAKYTRLLGEPVAVAGEEAPDDALEEAFDRLLTDEDSSVGFLIAAAWRSALWRAGDSPKVADSVRTGLVRLLSPL
jgi:AcrR family transcriptional regulator